MLFRLEDMFTLDSALGQGGSTRGTREGDSLNIWIAVKTLNSVLGTPCLTVSLILLKTYKARASSMKGA